MSIVIFIPIGEEYTDLTGGMEGGIVNKIGNEKPENLTVKNDNHQRTFLVKNDDDSLEVFNIVKRTTADLVLPDNRMALITFVDYHKHFNKIPLKEIGLDVIIEKDLNIKDSLINTINTIQSLQRATSYRYIILDKDYNKLTTNNIEIPNKRNILNAVKDIVIDNSIGKTLLLKVKQKEQNDGNGEFVKNLDKGYITIIEPSKITEEEWIKNAVESGINITDEEEIPLDIMGMAKAEQSVKEPSKKSVAEPSEESEKESAKDTVEEED